MLSVYIICVGKMKEKFFRDAFEEYVKRLRPYCKFQCIEIPETILPSNPSENDILGALKKEEKTILTSVPCGASIVSLCIEGNMISSEELADYFSKITISGKSKICFIIGGSYGLSQGVKDASDFKLSISRMTFPHHLARLLTIEQIYRAFKINEGSAYHK